MSGRIIYTWRKGWGWGLVGDDWSWTTTGFWTPFGAWVDYRRHKADRVRQMRKLYDA